MEALQADPAVLLALAERCEKASDAGYIQCPKCGALSGDDWSQCGGSCPMTASPYYNESAEHAFG